MNLKQNRPYQIIFFDHSCNSAEPKEIIIHSVGFFVQETKNFYHFSHWMVEDKDMRNDNWEISSILKTAVIKIKEIKNPIPVQ